MPEGDGFRVLLVGAGSAIGRATADAFLESGARVAVHDDDPAATRILVSALGTARVLVGGSTGDTADAAALLRDASARLGGLDACIRILPGSLPRPTLEMDDAEFAADVDRLLLSTRRVAMAAALAMRGRGGSIVLVGTVDAFHAYPNRSVASVAMTGTLGLVRSMAVELAPIGVRVNAVLAGAIDQAGASASDAQILERTLLRSPMHRLGTPIEVAAAVRFVAGPGAAFMTGQTLRVDGGWASLNQAPDGMKFR